MQGPTPRPDEHSRFPNLLERAPNKLELLEHEVLAYAGGSVAHGRTVTRLVPAVNDATIPLCQTLTSDVTARAERSPSISTDVRHVIRRIETNATRRTRA